MKGWLAWISVFIERIALQVLASIGMGVWCAMGLRWLSDFHPLFELATHFSLHAWVASSALVLVQFILWGLRRRSDEMAPRWRRRALLAIAPMVFFTWVVTPWQLLPLRSPASSPSAVKVLCWNMLLINDDTSEVRRLIDTEQPDVLILIEANLNMDQKLAWLRDEYPHCQWMPSWHPGGMIVASRVAGTTFEVLHPAGRFMPGVVTHLPANETVGPLHILAMHTFSPKPNEDQRTVARDQQLEDLGKWASQQTEAAIVIGDLNITPWSPPFWRLLAQGRLESSTRFRGYQPSWPASLGQLGIPIDHALVNERVNVLDRRVLPDSQRSDHRAIVLSVAR